MKPARGFLVVLTMRRRINAAGVITGDYLGCGAHAFVRDRDGELTTFDSPAGSTSPHPAGINDRGAITGSYYNSASGVAHGFLRIPDHDEEETQQRARDGHQP